MPVLRSWVLADKERVPEILSRLPYPSTAGLFGVGASSARQEADRKTQLNLRRIALLILASAKDAFVAHLTALQGKLVDLLQMPLSMELTALLILSLTVIPARGSMMMMRYPALVLPHRPQKFPSVLCMD